MTRGAVVLALGLLGCDAQQEIATEPSPDDLQPAVSEIASAAPPPASASAAGSAAVPHAAANVAVSGTIGTRAVTFSSGYARLKLGALDVVLTDRPIACGAKPPKDAQTLKLTVPPSSDGRFFTGSSFGAWFDVEPGAMFLTTDESMITVLDAQPTPGGSLVFEAVFDGKPDFGEGPVKLAGKASVPICAEPGEKLIQVDKPGGDEMKFVNAIASRRKNGSIDDIWLFTETRGSCANRNKPNRFSFLDLMDVTPRAFAGKNAVGVQPIRPGFHAPAPDHFMSGGSADSTGYGEITWESFDTKPGGKLKGRFELWSYKGQRNGSAVFEATVCP